MKLLAIAVTVLAAVQAQSQAKQCLQLEFSGEATQTQGYRQRLGEDLTFSVDPMRLRDDPKWAWFQIRVLPNDGVFVFNLSDWNWLLAVSDFRSVFIGGPNSDLNATLQCRSRYLAFPLQKGGKDKATEAANLIRGARTTEEMRRALAALKALRLAQILFELSDYRLEAADPPMGVDWVKFKVKLTLPDDFRLSGEVAPIFVECPAIPDEMVKSIGNPDRHRYSLFSAHDAAQPR